MEKSSKKLMKDIGERGFLAHISHLIDKTLLDFNDDASAIELPSGESLIVNVDMLISKTDVLPGMSFKQIGKKAVTMAISDIIAKGATPLGCLASVGFPAELEVTNATEVIFGIKEQCSYHKALFLGGDLNESSEIIVDVVSFGLIKDKKIIARFGAKEGDLIYTTGLFGFTSLGFQTLLKGLFVPDKLKEQALHSVYEPTARMDFLSLLQSFPIKICMDSSDGLLVTLSELSKLNDMGIDVTKVPLPSSIQDFSSDYNINPLDLAFKGGEEFELIFAISPDENVSFLNCIEKLGLNAYFVGFFSNDHKEIKIKDASYENFELPNDGFEHFKI